MMLTSNRPWLLLLPRHLGDGICAAVLINRCFAGKATPGSLDVVTSEALRSLFADIEGVCHAYSYEHLAAESLPAYEWVLDLLSNDISFAASTQVHFGHYIFRTPSVANTTNDICVRNRAGELLAAYPSPTFNKSLVGRSAEPNLPIWMLNAPLVSHVTGGSIWKWLDEDDAPRLQLRDDHPILGPRDYNQRPQVAFVPCASLHAKCWPEHKWEALCNVVQAMGWFVTLVLGPWEKDLYANLRRRPDMNILDCADLRVLARFFRQQHLVVANDCGPMHLAAAQGVPTIAIFGPTNPRCWFYYRSSRQTVLQKSTDIDPWGMLEEPHSAWPTWPSVSLVAETARRLVAGEVFAET